MIRSRTITPTAALAVLLVLIAAACGDDGDDGSSGATGTEAQAGSNERVTITFWDNQQTASGLSEVQQTAIDEFEASHPNITVEAETVPYADYQVLRTRRRGSRRWGAPLWALQGSPR